MKNEYLKLETHECLVGVLLGKVMKVKPDRRDEKLWKYVQRSSSFMMFMFKLYVCSLFKHELFEFKILLEN